MANKSSDSAEEVNGKMDMAFGRTDLALERILMAWIRTTVALIGFGFTIFKFPDSLQSGGILNLRPNAPRNLGLFLILLGMSTLILAMFQFEHGKRMLSRYSKLMAPVSVSFTGAIGVLLVGLFTLLKIGFGLGGL